MNIAVAAAETTNLASMHARFHPVGGGLASYWATVMGGTTGLSDLVQALSTGDGTLSEVLRNPVPTPGSGNVGAEQQRIPDVHGTDRSIAAVALTLERAFQIVKKLAGGDGTTRGAVQPINGNE